MSEKIPVRLKFWEDSLDAYDVCDPHDDMGAVCHIDKDILSFYLHAKAQYESVLITLRLHLSRNTSDKLGGSE